MKLNSHNYSKFTKYYVFIILCLLPLFFLPFSEIDAFRMPKFLLWLIALISTLVFIIIERTKTKERLVIDHHSKIYHFFGIYILIWIVSTIFSVDRYVSITGLLLFNGLFQLIMSIITFLLVTNFFQLKLKYLKYTIIVFCIVSIYCIAQFYHVDPFVSYYGANVRNFLGQTFATIGNQNQVATCLSVIFVIAAFFFILNDYRPKEKYLYFIALLIIFAGDIATNTRGGWLAVVCAFIVALPLMLRNSIFFKRYISVCAACCIVFIAIDLSTGGSIFNRFLSIFYEGGSVVTGNFSEDLGSRRMEIWINSIELIKKYWLIGSGPDTFAIIYNSVGSQNEYMPDERAFALNPHNESLRLLITTGIFSLIMYWIIVISIMKRGIKKIKDNIMIVPFVLGMVCYLIKGMLNCSIITDMIIFWVLLAIIYSFKQTETDNNIAQL